MSSMRFEEIIVYVINETLVFALLRYLFCIPIQHGNNAIFEIPEDLIVQLALRFCGLSLLFSICSSKRYFFWF
jgi:hypothetical protein